MQTEEGIQLLKDAGLSGYEAKAYIALLTAGQPTNGYEVAKVSGVPRSTVYETLGKLVSRGAAFEVSGDGSAVSYVAIPYDTFIGRIRRQANETIAGLESVLPLIGKTLTARVVQHLSGEAEVVTRAIDVIESAQRAVWLSVWPHEADQLIDAVRAAAKRGVDVFTIAYGEVGDFPGRMFHHSFSEPDVVEARVGSRLSIAVADHNQVMIAAATSDDFWGMWSDDRAVSLLAAEHVRHDIALQLTAEHLVAAGYREFWEHNPDIEALRVSAAAAMNAHPATVAD